MLSDWRADLLSKSGDAAWWLASSGPSLVFTSLVGGFASLAELALPYVAFLSEMCTSPCTASAKFSIFAVALLSLHPMHAVLSACPATAQLGTYVFSRAP